MSPLVSISVITYNHGSFIKECIEGLLMQKTTFNYEILINDDASTDDTAIIISEYEKIYPELIKAIYQPKNLYSLGQRSMNAKFNFPRAKGKYIALCEGDDYWTDPLKLQKQVDFLEANPDYSACFTNAKIINKNSIAGTEIKYLKIKGNKSYTIEDIIAKGGGLFPTASFLFKNINHEWPDFIFRYTSGDRVLSLILGDKGEFYFLNIITCVYREHEGGVFSSIKKDSKKRKKFNLDNIELLKDFNIYTNHKYDKTLKRTISKLAKIALLKDKKSAFMPVSLKLYKYLNINDWFSFIKNI